VLCAYVSQALYAHSTLGDCTWRDQYLWEKKENISEVWEKSAAGDSAEPNSKEMLLCIS
jgi:hypothetical protein